MLRISFDGLLAQAALESFLDCLEKFELRASSGSVRHEVSLANLRCHTHCGNQAYLVNYLKRTLYVCICTCRHMERTVT
uniref:Uncharacterized protein n=1 Tax=Salix viminalis TaxID=40686 RepID=A0A6N2LB74_SALVM